MDHPKDILDIQGDKYRGFQLMGSICRLFPPAPLRMWLTLMIIPQHCLAVAVACISVQVA